MAKKIEINENWEPIEVEDLDNLFVVIFKHGSFDNGYVEAFDTDDILMQSAYDSLAKQYAETDCDELTKIYLIRLPNTEQVTNMCNTGLFNGSSCDPHVIEATKDLFNRADCEQLSCWEGCGLTEGKKKKKVCSSITYTTGDPALNMKHFNKCMGTDGLGNPADHPHLIVGDTLPNAPVVDARSSDGASDAGSSAGEGGAISESLNEAKEESLEDKIRSVIAHKETDDWHDGKAYLFEVSDESKNSNNGDIDPFWIEKFDDGDVDFSKLTVYERTPEEKENGKCVATFMLSGGKNGSGDWTDYLDKLTETFEDLEEETGTEPVLYKLDTDICDDVWTAYVFLYDHDTEVEESLLEAFKENLTEAKLDYTTQKLKMGALESGARGFNAKAASNEKLQFNRMVCQKEGYTRALKIIEDEMIERGLLSRKSPARIMDITFEPGDFNLAAAKVVWADRNNPEKLIADYSNLSDALICLIFALWMKQADLAGKIKDFILNTYTVTLDELKSWLNLYLKNPVITIKLNQLVYASGICVESLEEEVLDEDKIWAERIGKYRELPSEVKLLDQKEVEEFIGSLEPEEEFKIGYVTPIYFYKELDDKFSLLKATELVGYTGLDYRDAAPQDVADHDERVANAKRQIDTYKDGAEGHALNPKGERFSATYTQTNKLVTSPVRDLETDKVDDQGQVIKNKTLLNRILFYPKIGSKPKVNYYLDVFSGRGYEKIDRSRLVSVLYAKVKELAFAKDNGITDADRKQLQKWGFANPQEFVAKFPGMTINDYRLALKLNIDPKDYQATYPFSRRWTMKAFSEKVRDTIEQDEATIGTVELKAVAGANRDLSGDEAKPQVRALYSNQVYYLEHANFVPGGKTPKKFGAPLKEAKIEENLNESKYTYAKDDLRAFLDEIRQAGPITIKKIGAYRFANYYTNGHPEGRPGGADWHNGWSRPPLKSPKCFIRLAKQNGDAFTLSIRKSCFDKLKSKEDKLINKTYNNFDELEKALDLKILKAFRDRWADEEAKWKKELARMEKAERAEKEREANKPAPKNAPGSSWIQITDRKLKQPEIKTKYSKSERAEAINDFNNFWLDPEADKDNIVELVTVNRDGQAKVIQTKYIRPKTGKVVTEFGERIIEEDMELDEAKRYVKRYYVRPLNIFCGNKEDIIQALIRAGDQNCSVYSLKRLDDHEDVHLLQPSDIIYYYDDHVLYDKNHVQVMDYDLFVKHEEDRKKVGNVDAMSDAAFGEIYDDRATEDDLKDQDVIANYKALNNISR